MYLLLERHDAHADFSVNVDQLALPDQTTRGADLVRTGKRATESDDRAGRELAELTQLEPRRPELYDQLDVSFVR